MDKYVKILSVESGEITATDNLRNFRIPEGDVYSLRDSFITFNCSVDVAETTAAGGVGIYNTGVDWVTTHPNKPHFDNVAFIRNASMRNAKQGMVESLRRIDVLKHNMGAPSEGVGQIIDKSYININQLPSSINEQKYSLFQQLNKVGGLKSRNAPVVPLSIRLSDIYDFCDTDEYDSTRGGELSLHLELNRNKLVAVQNMLTADVKPAGVLEFQNVGPGVGNFGNQLVVGNTSAAGVNVTTLFTDLAQSPYYVGQKLLISGTGVGDDGETPPVAFPNLVDSPAVVSQISWDRTTGQMILDFELAWWGTAFVGTQAFSDVTAKVALCTPTLRINESELVLKRLSADEVKGYDSINYTTFTCEEGNGNHQANFQNLFTIEPRANQAYMCFADNTTDDLISSTAITSFRCALNNIDVTDRDIVVKSPLYYDRLAQTLRGMGRMFNNGGLNLGSSSENGGWPLMFKGPTNETLPVVASMFATESNKFLQVRTGGAYIESYQLFKSIPRVFSY